MDRAGRFNPVLFLLVFGLCIGHVVADSEGNVTNSVSSQYASVLPEMHLFFPSEGSIHSTQINDAVNGKDGRVLFATSFGLSEYNGSWKTRHITRSDLRFSILDDFVTALEYDSVGNLWIGYAEGIQIDNGSEYQTVRDQQLLKSLRIKDFQRWGDMMWVATGNSGVHMFSNGTWTWFKPMSRDGPGFYEADSMALDPRNNVLYIASEDNGVWQVTNDSDPFRFKRIDTSPQIPPPVLHVRQDPLGGAYFFNRENVTRYSPDQGWKHILSIKDLLAEKAVINDIEAAPDGTLFIGTDDGILIWKNGILVKRLARFEGTGTSAIINWLFLDAQNRLWFATPNNVGYYFGNETFLPVITVQIHEISPAPGTSAGTTPGPSPKNYSIASTSGNDSVTQHNEDLTLLDRLMKFLSGLFPIK